jgi:hypothetical protein
MLDLIVLLMVFLLGALFGVELFTRVETYIQYKKDDDNELV